MQSHTTIINYNNKFFLGFRNSNNTYYLTIPDYSVMPNSLTRGFIDFESLLHRNIDDSYNYIKAHITWITKKNAEIDLPILSLSLCQRYNKSLSDPLIQAINAISKKLLEVCTPLEEFPENILDILFSRVGAEARVSLSRVNRAWQRLVTNPKIDPRWLVFRLSKSATFHKEYNIDKVIALAKQVAGVIKEINLSGPSPLTGVKIVDFKANGEIITLDHCKNSDRKPNDNDVRELLDVCKKIKRLYLSYTDITEEIFCILPSQLTHLQLMSCKRITKLPSLSENIRVLSLWSSPVSEITSLPKNLRKLELCCTKINDYVLEKLPEWCPNLKSLDLSGCEEITASGLNKLTSLKCLKEIDLTNCSAEITTEELYQLRDKMVDTTFNW